MLTWVLVTVTAVAAIGVLALLVMREPLGAPRTAPPPIDGPADVRRGFRLVWPGYDPAEVDAHLAAIDTWLREELEEDGGDGAGGLDR
ncbi:MAG: DivIVA domain-containing protein [Egicoccus sp.]